MSNIFLKNFSHCFPTFKCLLRTNLSIEDDDKGKVEAKKPLSSINNFNSLYNPSVSAYSTSDLSADDELFSTVLASERFFFSTPSRSNSIVDSSEAPSPHRISGGVAVQTDSPDPFADFRRSMQEMVEAHESMDSDFLHNLLLSYLNLNPKHTHKYIVGAFSDLIVSLLSSPSSIGL